MAVKNWKYYSFPDPSTRALYPRTIEVRVAKLGRAKDAPEEWQVKIEGSLFLDYESVEDVIARLTEWVDVEDAIVRNEIEEEFGSSYIKSAVEGWSSDISAEVIEQAKAYVANLQTQEQVRKTAAKAQEQQKLRDLAEKYPELLKELRG